jgi:hypothetical protein
MGSFEMIEMKDMDQCQLMGAKWMAGKGSNSHEVTGFDCLEAK